MRGIRRVLWSFQIKHLTPTLINLETGEVTSKLGRFLMGFRRGEPWVSLKEYRTGNAVLQGGIF